ncbi:MAG: thiosulfohydrolase SoxB [Rhodobacterales bacterium]|jgi:sulfur-oxidizing protein SoxB|nr:MAG: thiosulfohydrolase SoxB [Rhodobacterales bacterium]
MISRRHFLQASIASSFIFNSLGINNSAKVMAQQKISEKNLLDFKSFGNVSIMHITDIHGQLKPLYFREPDINLGVGNVLGKPPHITGKEFLKYFNIPVKSADAYSLSSEGFSSLAKTYGKMGGLDRIATVVKSIRSERPNALLLDGGDTWQGSYTALKTNGMDMVKAFNLLEVNAMTSHWEFTLGIERVMELVDNHLNFPFLGANIFDTEWDERAFEPYTFTEQNGKKIAIIGQAFPYMPIANPSWMFPGLSFGIREKNIQEIVNEVKSKNADLVVLLSHNGFDVDRQLATRTEGIDIIFCGHTHDALPIPIIENKTLLVASGSNGKFLSRIDLNVDKGIKDFKYRLIPIFSDVISSDKEMANLINEERKPFLSILKEEIGETDSVLYRRGNFNGTWDDLICNAIIDERGADIALSPGFRWGPSLIPGSKITIEDIYNATAMSYPKVYLTEMTGNTLKIILEDVADNLFNPDPYYQQGGDMVRVGGMGYKIDINKSQGNRISEMTMLKTGDRIEPEKKYKVGGWASVNENTEGPPVWELVEKYIRRKKIIQIEKNNSVKVITG